MSSSIIVGFDDIVGTYVHASIGGRWVNNQGTAIGLVNNSGTLIAGVTYSQWNGRNVFLDIFTESPMWCRYAYLHCWLSYPFDQLGCERITGTVCSTNEKSIKMCEHVGFELEATMKNATPKGDTLIFSMFKNQCRYLEKPAHFAKVITNG